MSEASSNVPGVVEVARRLASSLDALGCEYAFGGAIALGFWTSPRGTLDVDITLFLPVDQPSACIRVLQQIGCEVNASVATQSLVEHAYCQVALAGRRVDVFLPLIPFYEEARQRRKIVPLVEQPIFIWDAATLCVFKMMFFRRKDIADVEQILQTHLAPADREWVLEKLMDLYGGRDPRVAEWHELVKGAPL